jgi:hypothetical protein
MITEVITNHVARAAIDALQKGDKDVWQSLFAEDAELFDDGKPRSLTKFADEVLGHERFRSIDHVENGGILIEGEFHSDTWGEFRTYFRFSLNQSERISRLEIGQAG